MDSPHASTSSSGSFDGTAFARLLLDSDVDTSTPPRITKFSFEDDNAGEDLCASFSGQFTSFYGLPYDRSPPPEDQCQDAASEHSSRGPDTPPAPDLLSVPSTMSSPPSMPNKSIDDALSRASSTLFMESRSFLPGQSLLSDTPSFLGLQDTYGSPRARSPSPATPPWLSRHQAQTMPTPTNTPQTMSYNARPQLELRRSSTVNRAVTVQQLALDLPLCRSRSSSLTALIHALEDASPGWYQSLMDSALPRSGSSSLLETSPEPSPAMLAQAAAPSPSQDRRHSFRSERKSAPLPTVFCSRMLDDLRELETLAGMVGRLPIPRPRTMALEVVESAFFHDIPPVPRFPAIHPLVSPPQSPDETSREREATVVQVVRTNREQDNPSSQLPASTSTASSGDTDEPTQPASANLAQHPKLSKTLGLRSLPSASRFLAPAPKTPSWRKRSNSRTRPSADSQLPVPITAPAPPVQPKIPLNTGEPLPKTPKSAKFQSLFRRRPSAPPVPLQDHDLGDTDSSSPRPVVPRAGHLSQPVVLPPYRPTRGSPTGKSVKHFSAFSEPPPRQPPLGSFLPM
ncbi:hypothetical protein C8Q76DRAFT_756457 [Earliella scabrosa]|nr:hypothetical protein C8Q76DRAFT_756457 [Earliella scabrosa]